MTIQVVRQTRPIAVTRPLVQIQAGAVRKYQVFRAPSGPRGAAARTGLGFFLPGLQRTPNQLFMRYESIGTTQLDAAHCRASVDAGKTALATRIIALLLDGAAIGTVTFAAGQTRGTVALSVTTLNDGQVLTIVGPATIDGRLADITITLINQ